MHKIVVLAVFALVAAPAFAGSEQATIFLDGFETGDVSRWSGEWSYPSALDTPAPLVWIGSAADLDDDPLDYPVVGLGGDYAVAAVPTPIVPGLTALWQVATAAPATATLAIFAWSPSDGGRTYYLVAEWEVTLAPGLSEILRYVPDGFPASLNGMGIALYVRTSEPLVWTVAGIR